MKKVDTSLNIKSGFTGVMTKNERKKKITKEEKQIKKLEKAPIGFIVEEEVKTKGKGKKIPQINELQEKTLKGNSDGKSLKCEGAKAIKLFIDGKEYKEKDFPLLFPNKYMKFNLKTGFWETKEIRGKLTAIKSVYFYFPQEMINDHEIIIKFRKKMDVYTYNISKAADSNSVE